MPRKVQQIVLHFILCVCVYMNCILTKRNDLVTVGSGATWCSFLVCHPWSLEEITLISYCAILLTGQF